MNNLLMLHGWGFSSAVFDSLKKKLDSNFIVTTPDRRGYGDGAALTASGSPDNEEPVSLSSPAMVLGWSLGGLSAMQLALRQPDMVTGLILLATTPCFVNRQGWSRGMDKSIFVTFQKRVKEAPKSAMQQFVRLNAASKPDRETRDKLENLSNEVAEFALQVGLKELEETDLRDAVSSITVPFIVMHGKDDRVVPVAASHWLHEHIVNSRLIEFPRGGHAFFIKHASEVVDQIDSSMTEFCND